MQGVPEFLRALDLTAEADERAIRRAYAQRLRRIDPGVDPHGFQQLRTAYEMALRWVQHRPAAVPAEPVIAQPLPGGTADQDVAIDAPSTRAESGPATATATATEAEVADLAVPEADTPLERGRVVFLRFCAEVPGFQDEAAARAALDAALQDPRLIPLDVRTSFEWGVLSLLIDGWRPGHEFLFAPACDRFAWERERRRLLRFGPAGAAMDAAVDERLAFYQFEPAIFEARRRVIRALRDESPPPDEQLAADMPVIEELIRQFPHWLLTVAPRATIALRKQAWDALPEHLRKRSAKASRKPAGPQAATSNGNWGWALLLLLFLVAKVCSMLPSPKPDPEPYLPRTPSTTTRSEPRAPAPAAPAWLTGPLPGATFRSDSHADDVTATRGNAPRDVGRPHNANAWPPEEIQAARAAKAPPARPDGH